MLFCCIYIAFLLVVNCFPRCLPLHHQILSYSQYSPFINNYYTYNSLLISITIIYIILRIAVRFGLRCAIQYVCYFIYVINLVFYFCLLEFIYILRSLILPYIIKFFYRFGSATPVPANSNRVPDSSSFYYPCSGLPDPARV